MHPLGYDIVFEIGPGSFPWRMVLQPLPFVILELLLVRYARTKPMYRVAGVALGGLAALFLLIGSVTFVPEFLGLWHDYKVGRSTVVEGIVENFHPAPALGQAWESFSVSGVDFSYNALDATPCFHNAPFSNGPVRPGLKVRVYYNGGCIQRVDIRH